VTTDVIFKIVPRAEWEAGSGDYHGSAHDQADGFLHFSTAAQLPETLRRYYAGQDDLLLVAVDTGALGAALQWEPARAGALFPHLYGELALDCVLWVKPLPLGDDGLHVFPGLAP